MDGPHQQPSSDPPVRRERKKWEKEPTASLSLYINEAELSKWTTNNNTNTTNNSNNNNTINNNKNNSSPPSLRAQSSSFNASSTSSSSTAPSTASSTPPRLQRSLSKTQLTSTLTKSPSSPKQTTTRARPPSPSPSPSILATRTTPATPAAAPSQPLKQQRGAPERFKSPRRATTPSSRAADNTEKGPPAASSSTPFKPSPPPSKSSLNTTTPPASRTADNTEKSGSPYKPSLPSSKPSSTTPAKPSPPPSKSSLNPTTPPVNPVQTSSSPPTVSSTTSPPNGGKAVDPSDKTRIVNFMCGVLKIFAHLAGLPEGAEKQKEVKLGALEKRCKERLPPGLCLSVLDVLNDFRFLNALYDIPDQLEDIKATTTEFEKKVNQFMSIISSKFGGMDLMKEQASVLSALRAALQSGNDVIITETLNKCREVGMDVDTVDLAQTLAKCLRVDAGISVADIPKYTTLMERAAALRLLDEDFAKTQTQRLAQIEDLLKNIEASATMAAQDGNLAPFRDLLDKARDQGANLDDLAPYRTAYQDLNSRLNAVREILAATKEKHHPKLQQALDKARGIPPMESTTPRPESASLRRIHEGDTGVHKMLNDAVQSGASVLSHLESVTSIRALLETSVSAEDKTGLEDVISRGSALGLTREVEAARNTLRGMDRIRIKCHLHTDIRILSVPRDTRFPDLKSKIEQTYGASVPFVMKYRDDVGDLITLASHEDLTTALQTMDASVETKDGTKRTTGPKLDVFLSLPSSNVRASLEVKERRSSSKLHPNTQLAASVQQLYDFLSAEQRRAATPQVPSYSPSPYSSAQANIPTYSSPTPSLYSPPQTLYSSPSYPDTSPPVPRARPATSFSADNYPPQASHHYDHLIDPEKDGKPYNLTPVPPKTAVKSSKSHKRTKARESKDRLFVAGKSFTP